MKLLIVLVLAVFSCATPQPSKVFEADIEKPTDLGRYEAVFRYSCHGETRYAVNGTSACQYPEKTTVLLEVAVPQTSGQVIARSARREVVKDFSGAGWVQLSLELSDRGDSVPVVITVWGEGSGIQTGKLYPYVFDLTHPILAAKVGSYCFASGKPEQTEGQYACQQPAGGPFELKAQLKRGIGGRYLITSDGCPLTRPQSLQAEFGQEVAPITIRGRRDAPGYCFVRLSVLYNDGTVGEHESYLDFWGDRYIPLSPPSYAINGDKVRICPPNGADFLTIDGKGRSPGFWGDGCLLLSRKKEAVNWAMATDKFGRQSIALISQAPKAE